LLCARLRTDIRLAEIVWPPEVGGDFREKVRSKCEKKTHFAATNTRESRRHVIQEPVHVAPLHLELLRRFRLGEVNLERSREVLVRIGSAIVVGENGFGVVSPESLLLPPVRELE